VTGAIFERLSKFVERWEGGYLKENASALRRRRNPPQGRCRGEALSALDFPNSVNGNRSLSESECEKIVFLFGIRNKNMTF
jgi:hypothetical protein